MGNTLLFDALKVGATADTCSRALEGVAAETCSRSLDNVRVGEAAMTCSRALEVVPCAPAALDQYVNVWSN